MQIVDGMQQISSFAFLELSEIFFLNIFHLHLAEPEFVELEDVEGWLYIQKI